MDETHRQLLLSIARRAIEAELRQEEFPLTADMDVPAGPCGGLFVSLHNGTRLRGCVGRIEGEDHSLPELVRSVALSVLHDPRFASQPVTLAEMADILIELSILSPLRRTLDPLELEPGVHGVYVRRGTRSGCFLPQVAAHMQWDREQMLSHCCADKAGLPADAWRHPDTEVFLFTAEVFSESPR